MVSSNRRIPHPQSLFPKGRGTLKKALELTQLVAPNIHGAPMFTQILLSTLVVFTPGSDAGKEKGYPNGKILIEAKELARKPAVVNKNIVMWIIDTRSPSEYRKSHVPYAVHIDVKKLSKRSLTWHGKEKVAGWPLRYSLGKNLPIVVYGDGSVKNAARLWWLLRYAGFSNVQLLNGGFPAYVKVGGKVEQITNQADHEQKGKTVPVSRLLATKERVLKAHKNKKTQIVDARSKGEFCGDVKKAKRGGSIPGAIHLEWTDLLDKKTKKFKSPRELRKLFEKAGIDLKKPLITHCQSGGRASVMAFALELMGAKEVKNYYRGWSEWGNAEETPVVRPKR